jgi:chorismate mutase/prephenate dehydratase
VSSSDDQLARLRREIDAVDDALHDLIMRRAALVDDVVAAKREAGTLGNYLRPGREAAILRRLTARNHGAFPSAALVRIWRELLCAMLPVQGPFSIVVGGDDPLLWETARDFYGSDTAMHRAPDAVAAARTLTDGTAELAVVAPDDHDLFSALAAQGTAYVAVVARLPFVAMSPQAGPRGDAFVLSRQHAEPSGDDRTVLAFDRDPESELATAGHSVVCWQRWPGLWLAEIEGFHDGGESRRFACGNLTATVLGAYPAPLSC